MSGARTAVREQSFEGLSCFTAASRRRLLTRAARLTANCRPAQSINLRGLTILKMNLRKGKTHDCQSAGHVSLVAMDRAHLYIRQFPFQT